MNALEVRDLTKHYKNFTLDRLSFDLPMGSVLGLIGENGAGKSTSSNPTIDKNGRSTPPSMEISTRMTCGSFDAVQADSEKSAKTTMPSAIKRRTVCFRIRKRLLFCRRRGRENALYSFT